MKLPTDAHVAIVDGEKFLLMQNRGTALSPKLQSEGTPDVELENKSAGTRHQDGRGEEPLEKFAHAAGVVRWLSKAVADRRIEQLLVIADPDTLGEMRAHYDKRLEAALIGELDRQLTGIRGPDIAKAIAAA